LGSVHDQLKPKGVTRLLFWQEYRAAHPDDGYSYTQFCFNNQESQSHLKLAMRQTHLAGEKPFIDYAGPTVPVVNPVTGAVGKHRSSWRCRASNYKCQTVKSAE